MVMLFWWICQSVLDTWGSAVNVNLLNLLILCIEQSQARATFTIDHFNIFEQSLHLTVALLVRLTVISLGEHVIVDVVFQSEFGRLFPVARAAPFRPVTIPFPLNPILHDLSAVVALYMRPRLLAIYPITNTTFWISVYSVTSVKA